jgi:hypothetical protein
MDDALIWCF